MACFFRSFSRWTVLGGRRMVRRPWLVFVSPISNSPALGTFTDRRTFSVPAFSSEVLPDLVAVHRRQEGVHLLLCEDLLGFIAGLGHRGPWAITWAASRVLQAPVEPWRGCGVPWCLTARARVPGTRGHGPRVSAFDTISECPCGLPKTRSYPPR